MKGGIALGLAYNGVAGLHRWSDLVRRGVLMGQDAIATFSWVSPRPGVWRLQSREKFIIATVGPVADGRGGYEGDYCWRDPAAGNKSTAWVRRGTVAGCKAWVERELAKFWNPPTIRSADAA